MERPSLTDLGGSPVQERNLMELSRDNGGQGEDRKANSSYVN